MDFLISRPINVYTHDRPSTHKNQRPLFWGDHTSDNHTIQHISTGKRFALSQSDKSIISTSVQICSGSLPNSKKRRHCSNIAAKRSVSITTHRQDFPTISHTRNNAVRRRQENCAVCRRSASRLQPTKVPNVPEAGVVSTSAQVLVPERANQHNSAYSVRSRAYVVRENSLHDSLLKLSSFRRCEQGVNFSRATIKLAIVLFFIRKMCFC